MLSDELISGSLAKKISVSNKVTTRLGRDGSRFFVEIPEELNHADDPELLDCELDCYFIEDGYQEDYEYLEHQREAVEEIFDFSESMARSEEEGWFYSNYDGGCENNVVDPSSES